MVQLRSKWSFWYHSSKESNWSRKSYIYITKTDDSDLFWGIFKRITLNHYSNGIFFIMLDDIFPDWSSPENRNGGFISIKIDDINLLSITKTWLERMITESITTNFDNDFKIHGLSISPKNSHFILKLWCNQKVKSIKLCQDLPLIQSSKFTSFSYKH